MRKRAIAIEADRISRKGSIFFNDSACGESETVYTAVSASAHFGRFISNEETGSTDSKPVAEVTLGSPGASLGPVHCSCFLSRFGISSVSPDGVRTRMAFGSVQPVR